MKELTEKNYKINNNPNDTVILTPWNIHKYKGTHLFNFRRIEEVWYTDSQAYSCVQNNYPAWWIEITYKNDGHGRHRQFNYLISAEMLDMVLDLYRKFHINNYRV